MHQNKVAQEIIKPSAIIYDNQCAKPHPEELESHENYLKNRQLKLMNASQAVEISPQYYQKENAGGNLMTNYEENQNSPLQQNKILQYQNNDDQINDLLLELDKEESQEKQSEIESQINSIENFSIEISSNQYKNLTQKAKDLIEKLFNSTDLEIKICNINKPLNKNFIKQLKEENIKVIDNAPQYSTCLIYEITQSVNSITQSEKLFYLNYYLRQVLLSKVAFLKFLIEIDSELYQFKMYPQGLQNEKVYNGKFQILKSQLDQTCILLINCKTQLEAKCKINLLRHEKLKEKLDDEIQLKNSILFSTFEVQDFTGELIMIAEQIKQKNPQIIYMGRNQGFEIADLQKRFVDFVSHGNIKLVQEIYQLSISIVLDQYQIDQQIRQIQEKYSCEIVVASPQISIDQGRLEVSVQISFWIQKQLNINNVDEINKIFISTFEIKLVSENQIFFWKYLLADEFEKKFNKNECITKYLERNLAIIEIKRQSLTAVRSKDQIVELLQSFDLIQRDFYCEQATILVFLKSIIYSKLVTTNLSQVASKFGRCLIKILKIDIENKVIKMEIAYNYTKFKPDEIAEEIQEKFINNLIIFDPDLEFNRFLVYLNIKNEEQFSQQYQISLQFEEERKNNLIFQKAIMLGLREQIQEIQEIINQYKNTQNQQADHIICQNKLVFNKIKQINFPKDYNFENTLVVYTWDFKIMIYTDGNKLLRLKSLIEKQIQTYEEQLIQQILEFSEKEIKFLNKHLSEQIEEFQKTHEILVSQKLPTQNKSCIRKSVASSLKFQGKELQIVYADISQIECDAIVNSCNDKMTFGDSTTLSGVAQSISEMAGTSYHRFCSDYITQHQQLKTGQAITFEVPTKRHIKYIINVATPIYSSGKQTNLDLGEIKKNIQAIFEETKKFQIQSIAIPIFGGGACGYSFSQASEVVLKEVINLLFSNKYKINTVIIAELMDTKISEFKQIQTFFLNPEGKKNNWQWQDGSVFYNYDDEHINQQIQDTYEQFISKGKEQSCELNFPFTKQPGTHTIDLENQKMFDSSLSQEVDFCQKTINNSIQYFINDQKVADALNEYLILQSINKNQKFSIFFKNYEVVINKTEMYQINKETKFKRKIQSYKKLIVDQKLEVQENQLVLNGKKFSFEVFQYEKFSTTKQKHYKQIVVESFDENINQKLQQILRKELDSRIVTLNVEVPTMPNEQLQNFEQFLQQNSLEVDGNVKQGKKVVLKVFQKKNKIIQQYIEQVKLTIKQYPQDWGYQGQNFQKTKLSNFMPEYQQIQNLFSTTDSGKIIGIYRIQNKALWDNYSQEKNKVIELRKQEGVKLQLNEQTRYLWHGVRSQHPKIIYEGLKEAFDQTYSNVGMWGQGIYFAENASYSRNYSYTLTAKDDAVNIGKLVILCCLVTTGKVEVRNPDNNIKRPSQGYDCVQGTTGGSNVFMLYSMDIRRAYPAYEVIFQ